MKVIDSAKFIVLRPPQTREDRPVIITPHIFEQLSGVEIEDLEVEAPLLYFSLKTIVGTTGAIREDFENEVEGFQETEYYKTTQNSFITWWPVIFEAIAYIKTIAPSENISDVMDELENIFGVSVNIYLEASQEKIVRTWDNLFAQYVIPTDGALRELFIQVVRFIEYLTILVDAGYSGNPHDDFVVYSRARVKVHFLLPNPDNYPEEPAPENPEIEPTQEQVAYENILAAQATKAELVKALDRQHREYRILVRNAQGDIDEGEIPDLIREYDSNLLTDDSQSDLSVEAVGYLESIGVDITKSTIDVIFSSIDRNINEQSRIAYRGIRNQEIVFINGIMINKDDLCARVAELSKCYQYEGPTLPNGKGRPLMLGMGDLKVLKTRLYKYELGEIAHIDNVLKGQYKERVFRDLRRTEESLSITEENESEKVKDSQTTERFELQKEISSVIQSDSQFSAGISTTASFGDYLTVSGGFNYSNGNSSTISDSVALQRSKEVVNRAVERVVSKVRTQRSFTRTNETEETNVNRLNNELNTSTNLAGIYRWVDKIYHNKVINYGKRLMMEFMIPEPAAFYIYQKLRRMGEERKLVKPVDPVIGIPGQLLPIRTFEDIDESNYGIWSALYDVPDIQSPPVEYVTVCAAIDYTKAQSGEENTQSNTQIQIPSGYWCVDAVCRAEIGWESGAHVIMRIGKEGMWKTSNAGGFFSTSMNFETDLIPVSVISKDTSYIINIEAICKVRPETIRDWKIKTYASIIKRYKELMEEYEEALSQYITPDFGVIQGQNPLKNRETEGEELKKHAISLITRQRYTAFDAMVGSSPSDTYTRYPEFRFDEAEAEGRYIQFFEQAFNWNNMMYKFYPYFWGRKFKWVELKSFKDVDPIFEKFLQSGAARVVVPVSEGYEKAALHYLATGEIWQGGDVPTPDDPLYQDIIDDLDGNIIQDQSEAWLTRIPTSLVYLQSDGTLPDLSSDQYFTDNPPVEEL